MQEMLFQRPTFKKIPGRACRQTPVANFFLRYSAHTFGDRILSWGRAMKMGPLAVLPHH
jgi:hypothetical protein